MLNHLLNIFLPYRKLRNKSLSTNKKIAIYLETIIQLLINISIILFITFKLFATEHTYKNIHLYIFQDKSNGHELKYLANIDKYLKDNILYDDNKSIDIYMANNNVLYEFLMPVNFIWTSFAATYPWINILVNKQNFQKNKVFDGDNKFENLDAVLAHEIVHTYQINKYGIFVFFFKTPTWVSEGYATYSSANLYIDKPKSVLKDFIDNYPDMKSEHITSDYKVWSLMVKHAIEKMHKSVDDLHLGKVEYDEVLYSLLREYKVTKGAN